MIANEIRVGKTLLVNNSPHKVEDVHFVRPGKGQAVVQTKLKNLLTGSIIAHRFNSVENVTEAELEHWNANYLYKDGENFVFMNTSDYNQMEILDTVIGNASDYLLENTEVHLVFYEGKCIDINLPPSVVLEVTEAPPNVKGNSASGTSKPCVMETGLIVNCPLFVEAGGKIKVDTRSGKYLERA